MDTQQGKQKEHNVRAEKTRTSAAVMTERFGCSCCDRDRPRTLPVHILKAREVEPSIFHLPPTTQSGVEDPSNLPATFMARVVDLSSWKYATTQNQEESNQRMSQNENKNG
jgi:hypothetical protein